MSLASDLADAVGHKRSPDWDFLVLMLETEEEVRAFQRALTARGNYRRPARYAVERRLLNLRSKTYRLQ